MYWITFEEEIKQLAEKINVQPDAIVGIVRGGLVPAVYLAQHLKVKDMYCITVRKDGNKRNVTTEILEDLADKSVLLVEDMLETGGSLIAAKKYMEKKGANVGTACLYIMPQSKIEPDYYLRQVNEVQKFPWEK